MVLPFALRMRGVRHVPERKRGERRGGRNIALVVDPCPMCVSVVTTLHKVDLLFRSLGSRLFSW